jgi:hypothetical protein
MATNSLRYSNLKTILICDNLRRESAFVPLKKAARSSGLTRGVSGSLDSLQLLVPEVDLVPMVKQHVSQTASLLHTGPPYILVCTSFTSSVLW